MTDRTAPTLAKWPFFVGDLLLLGLAWWIMTNQAHPLGPWPLLILIGCVLAGAWLAVTPFLRDHEAALRFAEADKLATTAALIDDLDSVSSQIRTATAQWSLRKTGVRVDFSERQSAARDH